MKDLEVNPSSIIHQVQETTEGVEEDLEMFTNEIKLKDMELSDILEQEGMDLPNMVENWKKKGMEHILEEEVRRINDIFIAWQWAEMELQSKCLGIAKGIGVCTQGLHQNSINYKHQKKRGRRTNNDALQ